MSQHHVPVIVYHEIVTEESREGGETVISLEKFSKQMEYLYRNGFGTLNMDELVEFMKRETEIEKSVAIHFDDGWKNLKHAIPVLEKYGFKASFWIITEKGIGNDYLEWDDIIALDRSPQFGVFSHTMSHPWDSKSNLITWTEGKVPGKGLKDAEWEIRESKRVLEVRLKKEIPYLAWPVGWYNKTLIRLAVDAGYEALMTTDDGFNIPGDDVLRIKRVMINGACSMSVFKSILQNPRYHDCRERPKIAEEYSRISNSDL
ncbi:MAG: polysaccharide deacetylase family protein [Candidatus Hodarchaeales archaeon]|jgi:peptidoglycan/xylan/chitin deacetylase (PgdA/CDA1 family)